jgi:hypothetical protein
VAFVWLGTVLAISFLETPLKFRAPGITVPFGLGTGRLVFPRPEHPRGRSDHRAHQCATRQCSRRGRLDAARYCGPAGHPDGAAAATPGPTSPTDHRRSLTTPIAAPPDLHEPGMPQSRDAHGTRSHSGHRPRERAGTESPSSSNIPGSGDERRHHMTDHPHSQNGRVTAGRTDSDAETGPTEPVRPPIQPQRTPTASPPRSSATRCARSQKFARAADCSSVMNPPPTWPRCGETART